MHCWKKEGSTTTWLAAPCMPELKELLLSNQIIITHPDFLQNHEQGGQPHTNIYSQNKVDKKRVS